MNNDDKDLKPCPFCGKEPCLASQKFENGMHMMALDGCSYDCGCLHSEEANTEAEARAKMLIYLLENNLLKLGGAS